MTFAYAALLLVVLRDGFGVYLCEVITSSRWLTKEEVGAALDSRIKAKYGDRLASYEIRTVTCGEGGITAWERVHTHGMRVPQYFIDHDSTPPAVNVMRSTEFCIGS